MPSEEDFTTLVCLFHHQDNANAVLEDLVQAGVTRSSITTIGGPDELDKSELASLGMPDKDYDHLKAGVRDGGVVVAVSNTSDSGTVENIFHKHSAEKIDETDATYRNAAPLAGAAAGVGETAIPIVEEQLAVGKRTVDAGGVKVYRRVVEIPVEQSINLREEHVDVDRHMVDRPATDADLAFGDRTIELTETAEEAVVGKTARVVEEVFVGKTATDRTETINDTVRRTEVEVEQVPGTATDLNPKQR